MQLVVLGREAELCRAEIAARSVNLERINHHVVVADRVPPLASLGGTVAVATVLQRLNTTEPVALETALLQLLQAAEPAGKLVFSLNWYSTGAGPRGGLDPLGLKLKKQLRHYGRASRYIAGRNSTGLTTAQLKFHQLLEHGYPLIVAVGARQTVIARTTEIPDIDWYSQRDYGRPCRDAKIGMLPPKLAQIMINLAAPSAETLVYDPFCGSGVVLQEAVLMGLAAAGSDIDPAMVQCAHTNLRWLAEQRPVATPTITQADARQLPVPPKQPVTIITEGYLGPVNQYPTATEFDQLQHLYQEFLTAAARALPVGSRLVCCLPCWPQNPRRPELPILDQIEQFGYNYIVFDGIDPRRLRYLRPGQRVGRHILALTRK